MPPKSGPSRIQIVVLIAICLLIVVLAAALLAALFGRSILAPKSPNSIRNSKLEEMFKMRRLEFPAMPPVQREAFDVRKLHEEAVKEWWYLNAHLFDNYNNLYCLMIAMLKDGNLYGILTDVKTGQKAVIAVTEASVKHDPDADVYSVGAASLTQKDPKFLCYQFKLTRDNVDLDLEACANKPPLAVNGNGSIIMGIGGESKYYSLTNVSLRGVGRMGEVTADFQGRGWIDRQWGDWSDADFDRWDWFSMQLEGETEIMLFQFWKGGKLIRKIGDICLPNQTSKPNLDFKITPLASWQSSESNVTWETGWEIVIPEYGGRLTVDADFQDQEVDPALWEGGTKISGRWMDQPIKGKGFFEARRRIW